MANSSRTVLSVSDLNSEVALTLQQNFGLLWLEGEISNFARPASGHFYFSLKDEKAQVRCAMFRNRNRSIKLTPGNGMQVAVRARVSLYEPRGEFQLVVEHMEEAGAGLLQQRFEALKASLHQSGLFDEAHKLAPPALPNAIGVITSPTGAAIRDILNVLKRRAPQIPIYIYPVAVQGKQSAPQVAAALTRASQEQRCDVLLLARGGGSIEDLWSFNEPEVAMAIHECELPVICGVGHEVDVTIADYIADVRAPTPSVAAELAAPDCRGLSQYLQQQRLRLANLLKMRLDHSQRHLNNLLQRLNSRHPQRILQQHQQRIDELQLRARFHIRQQLQQKQQRLERLSTRLATASPRQTIHRQQQAHGDLTQRLHQAINERIETRGHKLAVLAARLGSLSPLNTLERGYSITLEQDSTKVLQHIDDISVGQAVDVQLQDGLFSAKVLSKKTSK